MISIGISSEFEKCMNHMNKCKARDPCGGFAALLAVFIITTFSVGILIQRSLSHIDMFREIERKRHRIEHITTSRSCLFHSVKDALSLAVNGEMLSYVIRNEICEVHIAVKDGIVRIVSGNEYLDFQIDNGQIKIISRNVEHEKNK